LAGPTPDCARLFGWLWGVGGHVGLKGRLGGIKPGTPGKVRHLDLRNQPGGGSLLGHQGFSIWGGPLPLILPLLFTVVITLLFTLVIYPCYLPLFHTIPPIV